jgi:hypothetical protein
MYVSIYLRPRHGFVLPVTNRSHSHIFPSVPPARRPSFKKEIHNSVQCVNPTLLLFVAVRLYCSPHSPLFSNLLYIHCVFEIYRTLCLLFVPPRSPRPSIAPLLHTKLRASFPLALAPPVIPSHAISLLRTPKPPSVPSPDSPEFNHPTNHPTFDRAIMFDLFSKLLW